MPTSDARILANQANAAHSTGPKTVEGKEKSRQNAYKHGLTGEGVVLAETDAVEVERRAIAFAAELAASGEVGQALARLAALNSVRMERGADQQTATLAQRCRQVEADFVAPEGVSDAEAARLRDEAVRVAMFDTSKEATLARKYEAAAERCFFKTIKELRQRQREGADLFKADETAKADALMASFLGARQATQALDDLRPTNPPRHASPASRPAANSAYFPPMNREVDVPMTIGRAR